MLHRRFTLFLCSFLLAVTALTFAAGPSGKPSATQAPGWWAQWRGPSGQGYADDARVPLTWSEKENIAWKSNLPAVGNSSPIIWGDRIFLTGSSENGRDRLVFCVRASDGKLLWQQAASKGEAAGRTHGWNGYASASCTTDGKHVYAFFGTPGLFCYDFDGKLIWKHSFGLFTSQAGWGTAASPFLFEDLVIQNCDNDGAKGLPSGAKEPAAPMALVALDKNTGKVMWTTPRDLGRGFSTPVLVPMGGDRTDLVLNGPGNIAGYDPRTGKERWRCVRQHSGQAHLFGEPMPVFDSQTLFVESGRPGPCQALRLPDSGDVTKSHILWETQRKGHRDVSSPILWEGLIYQADSKGTLTCTELKTGKELFSERIGNGTNKSMASPIAVQGKLLFVLDDGVTVVIEPGPDLKVVRRNTLGEGKALDFGASPAVAAGRLFLRSQAHLYCIAATK